MAIPKLARRLTRFIERRTTAEFAITAVLLAAFVGWVDDVTGMEVSVALLYLLPVMMAAWYVGRLAGFTVSLQCAIEGFIAERTGFSSYSHPAIPFWNSAMMLGFFLAVTILLVALKASLNHEEELARTIQESLLPASLNLSSATTVAANWKPSVHVGGDYFDLLPIDPGRFGLCIADISGHGIPAALLMSNIQSAVRLLSGNSSPTDLCSRLNQQAVTSFPDGAFLTMFYAFIDLPRRELTYCNAGHHPPILLRRNGAVNRLLDGGIPLGVSASWSYTQGSVTLEAGDKVLLYTDGITEAKDLNDELFGEERLMDIVIQHRGSSPADINNAIMSEVETFTRGYTDDDITLMCVAINDT
jgi:hypothetical protein